MRENFPFLDPPEHSPSNEAAFSVVAVGSSAGGVGALGRLFSSIPADFSAAFVVVQHLDPRHRSLIVEIIDRRTMLTVDYATDGSRIAAGTILFAPPNRHLLVNADGSVSLTETELVHFVRPSADLLFDSVAAAFRERAIAVVLTGSGTDGAWGVQAIKKMGGTVIVEDQRTAEFTGMPTAAIQTGCADFILPLDEIGPALVSLVVRGAPG
ncbi:MAG: chemotaxis protein CheB [Actinobacteria bacterium]|nr:MAG: chemotaxis protein CheB [Actinomycetota bacterium]